jgi:hypothetical protein
VLGQVAHTGPVTLLAAGLERQQGQILSEAVQDCVGGTFFICIDLQVMVDGLPCVVHGEPSAACGVQRQRPMQNQTASLRSAKPQPSRLRRRVAASFNHPAAGKAGIASRLAIAHQWPGLPEPGRWADQASP